jgi:5-formyltetrahydrofolate cyclo-ligase
LFEDEKVKAVIRERVWTALEEAEVSPAAHGRIPDFVGSGYAAVRLSELPGWRQARKVKVNPDRAQQPARQLALSQEKLVFMAVPKLALSEPFYRLDPAELNESPGQLADRRRAAEVAPTASLDSLPPIDFIICGSVAVNYDGVRVGKGAGYTDIEVALLADAGLLKPDTIIATTVHDLQVLDEDLPHRPHDFTVDYILTPERLIPCERKQPPTGIDWQALKPDLLESIPVLQRMWKQHTTSIDSQS